MSPAFAVDCCVLTVLSVAFSAGCAPCSEDDEAPACGTSLSGALCCSAASPWEAFPSLGEANSFMSVRVELDADELADANGWCAFRYACHSSSLTCCWLVSDEPDACCWSVADASVAWASWLAASFAWASAFDTVSATSDTMVPEPVWSCWACWLGWACDGACCSLELVLAWLLLELAWSLAWLLLALAGSLACSLVVLVWPACRLLACCPSSPSDWVCSSASSALPAASPASVSRHCAYRVRFSSSSSSAFSDVLDFSGSVPSGSSTPGSSTCSPTTLVAPTTCLLPSSLASSSVTFQFVTCAFAGIVMPSRVTSPLSSFSSSPSSVVDHPANS